MAPTQTWRGESQPLYQWEAWIGVDFLHPNLFLSPDSKSKFALSGSDTESYWCYYPLTKQIFWDFPTRSDLFWDFQPPWETADLFWFQREPCPCQFTWHVFNLYSKHQVVCSQISTRRSAKKRFRMKQKDILRDSKYFPEFIGNSSTTPNQYHILPHCNFQNLPFFRTANVWSWNSCS